MVSSASLRKLIRYKPTKEERDRLDAELHKLHDRVAGIIATTRVENAVFDALQNYFVLLSETQKQELFDGDAPIATFSARIKLGFALGLFREKTLRDLIRIKDVRNAFAHAGSDITFLTPEISRVCEKLECVEVFTKKEWRIFAPEFSWPPSNQSSRERFISTTVVLAEILRLFGNQVLDEQKTIKAVRYKKTS